jgi:hypothetical protein
MAHLVTATKLQFRISHDVLAPNEAGQYYRSTAQFTAYAK